MKVDNPQFFKVEQFASKYPAFTPSSLRWLLFNRANNGLDAAVIQLGRRVLIDEAAFVAWLRDHRQAAA
ncbi:MAG: DNA-binding protein [Rudaea sp.]|nr:DNA-binding protein [Rudaea sp.]